MSLQDLKFCHYLLSNVAGLLFFAIQKQFVVILFHHQKGPKIYFKVENVTCLIILSHVIGLYEEQVQI